MEKAPSAHLTCVDYKTMGNTLHYLAQEIRDAIYATYFAFHYSETPAGNGYDCQGLLYWEYPPELPNICQVFPDAIPEYLRITGISLSHTTSIASFATWLRELSHTNLFPYIRVLELPILRFNVETNAYIEGWCEKQVKDLLGRCVRLRKLTVLMHIRKNIPVDSGYQEPPTGDDIKSVLEKHWIPLFDGLAKLKALHIAIRRPDIWVKGMGEKH